MFSLINLRKYHHHWLYKMTPLFSLI